MPARSGRRSGFPDPPARAGSERSRALLWLASLALHLGLLLAAVALAAALPGWPALLLAAVLSAFATVHIGYHAHDLSHGQLPALARGRRALELLVWNGLLGVSAGWWRDKHGRHHAETQVAGSDPDLYELFVYEDAAAARLHGPRRWFAARQHWWFWPATALARLYYHCFSLLHALALATRGRPAELALLLAHHAIALGAAWQLLGAPRALVFLGVAQLLSGLYMGLAFATNHLGMPHAAAALHGREWQVPHTRNVRTGRLGDYLLGGLNYQIEHHLYPWLDRAGLRAAQPLVERHCREAGIGYHRTSLATALGEVQRSLAAVAAAARRR